MPRHPSFLAESELLTFKSVPFRPPDDAARFPVDSITDEVLAALLERLAVVVIAPPGAGKTTRLPLAVLDAPFAQTGTVILTQPRRLASRMAAERLASTVGKRVGDIVGLRTGEETKVSARTKLTVMTEGVLVRMLQSDATLDGVSTVLFDEVHERSLDVDLAMALLRDVRASVRPDLRVGLLSATLDGAAMAAVFDGPVLRSDGRAFPVERRWEPVLVAEMADATAAIASRELGHMAGAGTVLVFVPGRGEMSALIRALDRRRHDASVIVGLHGGSSRSDTNDALAPLQAGERRLVIATNVAQTSLTLPDVRVVIDQGLARRSVTDPQTGLTRLAVERVSQSTATQRAGRAGRTAPGRAIALWSEAENRSLAVFDRPEIERSNLTDLVLASLRWGARTIDSLSWVTKPAGAAWDGAVGALSSLDAVDDTGRLTELGHRMAAIPVSAPLARLVLGASALPLTSRFEAIALVAILATDRRATATVLADETRSLAERLASPGSDGSKRPDEAERLARRLLQLVPTTPVGTTASSVAGLVSLAMPKRLAARSTTNAGRYCFADGLEAVMGDEDPARGAEVIVALQVDADRRKGRIFSALAVDPGEVVELHGAKIATHVTCAVVGDALDGEIIATSEERLGAAVIRRRQHRPTPTETADAVLAALDLSTLDRWLAGSAFGAVRPRVAFLHRRDAELSTWPDLSPEALLASADSWLRSLLVGAPVRRPLRSVSPDDALAVLVSRQQWQLLERRAPSHVRLPTTRNVAVDYDADAGPTVRGKLQEFFGTKESPTVDGISCVVELLTPAGRPAAITNDLARFWDVGYPHVRAEMRGRYPRHDWPADPLAAVPQRGVKRPQ